MWICRGIERISWIDKVTDEDVLRKVNEDKQILTAIWRWKHCWMGHVLRRDGLLRGIIKGRMKGKEKITDVHDLPKGECLCHTQAGSLRKEGIQKEIQWNDVRNLLYSRRLKRIELITFTVYVLHILN